MLTHPLLSLSVEPPKGSLSVEPASAFNLLIGWPLSNKSKKGPCLRILSINLALPGWEIFLSLSVEPASASSVNLAPYSLNPLSRS